MPPYFMIQGNPGSVRGLNVEGMKRRGVAREAVNELKEAYVDNLLKPELRSAIEVHIADCDQCRARIALCSRSKAGMGKAVRATLGNPMPSRQQPCEGWRRSLAFGI